MKTPIIQLKATLPSPLRRLADLAYNYWWSWTAERISLFSTIEPTVWQACNHNPVALLESVAHERLSQIAEDPHYLKRLQALAHQFDHYMQEHDTWAGRIAPHISPEEPVAYFPLSTASTSRCRFTVADWGYWRETTSNQLPI